MDYVVRGTVDDGIAAAGVGGSVGDWVGNDFDVVADADGDDDAAAADGRIGVP